MFVSKDNFTGGNIEIFIEEMTDYYLSDFEVKPDSEIYHYTRARERIKDFPKAHNFVCNHFLCTN